MPYSSRIPQVIVELEAELEALVDKAGLAIQAGAQQRARVKTGYMRGEIRWVKDGRFSGTVEAGADYTIFNEFGTVHMAAQPMFGPATEEVRAWFDVEVNLVVKKAIG